MLHFRRVGKKHLRDSKELHTWQLPWHADPRLSIQKLNSEKGGSKEKERRERILKL